VTAPEEQLMASSTSASAVFRASASSRSVVDGISFQDCGVKLPAGSACGDPSPVLRSYNSFSQAATENALSRILIGFHFRKSIEEGTQYGRKIGERAATNYLQPVL